MTVIAARICSDGTVQMSADSRVSWGLEYVDGGMKCWQLGGALVGLCGPTSLCDVVSCHRDLGVNPPAGREETEAWCHSLFDAMHKEMTRRGQIRGDDGRDSIGASVLVATRNGIWTISHDGAVIPIPRAWHAVGSGAAEARGALSVGVSAPTAVQVACGLVSDCGGPITIMALDGGGDRG